MLKLYLDDVRTPVDKEWIIARNYSQFKSLIKLHGLENFELISLDHDLGDKAIAEYHNNVKINYVLNYENIVDEKTGYDCAKFLVNHSINNNVKLPKIQVHSANPIGSANIIGYINNYLKNCRLPQDCVRIKVPFRID